MTDASKDKIGAALDLLRGAGYQILEKFTGRAEYCGEERDGLTLGVVLDTETTGRDPEVASVIELGMVFFEFDASTGVVYRIVDVFDELCDPGIPIPAEASAVNGITDEMVQGKSIDAEHVADLISCVDVVIAHNAHFDRTVCEKVWPIFKTKAWACTFRQIDWALEGLTTAKLEFLAYKRGFHYEAHRAEMDCRALLHVLQAPFAATEMSTLHHLLQTSNLKETRVWATDTPFHVKDVLKERGYFWSDGTAGREKAWFCTVSDELLEAELVWLKANAYNNRASAVVLDYVDATNRFSPRREGTRRQYI